MVNNNFNPAVAILNANKNSVPPHEIQETENPRIAMANKVPVTAEYSTESPQEEKRQRRFQALFRPSVFNALEYYCKVHKISINEALEQFVTTEKHLDSIG